MMHTMTHTTLSTILLRPVFFIALSILLCKTFASTAQESERTIHHTNNNTVTNTITINLAISQEMVTSIVIALHQVQAKLQEYYGAAADAARTPLGAVRDTFVWMQENKIATTVYATALSWLYTHYFLVKLKYKLSHADNWSLWNPTLSIEELFAVPFKQLGETLGREAQIRYTSVHNPTDVLGPIVTFMQALDYEKDLLTSYIDTCTLLKSIGLQKIIWSDFEFVLHCKKRLTRLLYLKNAFTHWITEYKLANPVLRQL